jgi:hypothetical protein
MFSGLGGKNRIFGPLFSISCQVWAHFPRTGIKSLHYWYVLSTCLAVGEWTSIRRELEPSGITRLYFHMVIVSQVLNLVKRKVKRASCAVRHSIRAPDSEMKKPAKAWHAAEPRRETRFQP